MTRRMATALLRCWIAAAVCVALSSGCARSGVHTGVAPEKSRPGQPRIPRDAARFEIESVDDSTVSFRVFEAGWIDRGQRASVVDPAHGDALIARLTILRSDRTIATALITSQAARVTTGHAVLVVRSSPPPWRTRAFWYGVATGVAIGAGTASVVR